MAFHLTPGPVAIVYGWTTGREAPPVDPSRYTWGTVNQVVAERSFYVGAASIGLVPFPDLVFVWFKDPATGTVYGQAQPPRPP